MSERVRRLVEAPVFNHVMVGVILINAIIVGLETSPAIMGQYGTALLFSNKAITAVFIVEIALRLIACGRQPLSFFRDGWNVFDFLVIAVSLLPGSGPFATVARLARVLRVLRLVSVSPELRLIVTTMLKSIPSLGNVGLLIALLMYIYAVGGVFLFGKTDPAHWGDLGSAMLACFKMLTLEGWVEMQDAVIGKHPYAWLFFTSFVVIAVFVVVNLFIAVVLNNLEKARKEEFEHEEEILGQLVALREQLDRFESQLRSRG